ncbi:TonB-dependent receptor [Chryseolinea sp. T2]|uniref:SusC/RagA family TonB-linked outer membrane protein n=1 Tax=Chryseolinea sp. T2 TaxID=3129255 RepID=UPI0030778DBC
MKGHLLIKRIVPPVSQGLPLLLAALLILSGTVSLAATAAPLQSIVVSGTITSEEEQGGLPGVSILVKGTSMGTVTDYNGKYTLEVPGPESVLVFTSIGYETQEVIVGGQTSIDLVLKSSLTSLQEVVVVGYGTQQKVSVTSAVGQVRPEELTRRPVTTLQQAMQGTVPGLTVLDAGGSPGSPNQQMVIRGANTLYTPPGQQSVGVSDIGNNQPLVIVDGIEQPLNTINPTDIESISVLKDASSSAIYGSRANNGVILITTKRAKEGRVAVNYSGYYAIQQATNQPEHMDLRSYMELQNIARTNMGTAPLYTQQQIDTYVEGSKTNPLKYPLPFDWHNAMFKNAPMFNNTLSVSGGSENFKARMSYRNQNQDGIIANTNSVLNDFRINTDFKASKKIGFAADLNYRNQNTTEPTGTVQAPFSTNGINEIFRQLMQNSIWAVPKYPNGDYGGGTQGNNPLLLAEKGGINRVISNYLTGSLTGSWEIVKDLKFSTQVAFRTNDVVGKNFVNTWEARDSTVVKKSNLINKDTETRSSLREVTVNSLLNYSKTFGDHSLKALLGYSQIANQYSTLWASRQGFYNNDVTSIGQGQNDATKDNGGSDSEWGLRSYFARVGYSFKDKYMFEANGRFDGSSRFTGDNQYSFFPSFSAGWRLSEESFFTNAKNIVSDLKLRGSWGRTGNNTNVGLYSFYPQLNPVTYVFGSTVVQGYEQQKIADPNITWETATQTDIGLDAEFFEGRFTFTMDYYDKTNRDILLALPVPGALGLQAGTQNAGVVQNKGWEFAVGNNHTWNAFTLRTNLNFALNNNKVVDLAGTGPFITGNDIDPRFIIQEGLPMNGYWGYKTDGLYQTNDEASADPIFMRAAKAGDVRMVDRDGDGDIDPNDMTFLGNSLPKYTYGGSINLGYKAFSLNIMLQGAADYYMRIARALGEQGNYEGFTPDIYTNNYWTPEHTDARFPRPTKQDLRNQASTDRMLVDASYLRVKNIQLSYQIPTALTQKAFIQHASVYVSGTNLLTFSKLNEWHLDPESTSGWQNYYPQTSMYTLGVNLQF